MAEVLPAGQGDSRVSAQVWGGGAGGTRSACTTGSTEVSHVLSAMCYPDEEARWALRLSLGRTTTDEEVETASELVPRVIASMRVGAVAVAADPLGQGVEVAT